MRRVIPNPNFNGLAWPNIGDCLPTIFKRPKIRTLLSETGLGNYVPANGHIEAVGGCCLPQMRLSDVVVGSAEIA